MPATKCKNASDSDKKLDSLDFNDEVQYKDFVEEKLPEHIIFPEELNSFLRDQIRDLSAENGCLRRALEEAERKIQNLQKTLASEVPICAGKASEIAAAKIVELSKKCREQTAEVEVLRSKCKRLEGKLASKETEIEQGRMKRNVNQSKPADNESNENSEDRELDKEEQLKLLNEKLQQANAKLFESKNTCISLRQEINKAQKLLCSEIGENVTIAGLSSHSGGWRGRAEQVQQLQQRVSELQCKLSEYEGSQKGFSVAMEQRNLANLRNMERERRQQMENATKELRQAEVSLEIGKKKLDAARARIKVLENELSTAKRSIALLNEKRMHDDQFIEALNGQLKSYEMKIHDRELEIQNTREKSEHELIRLRSELSRVQMNNEYMQRKVEERETEIEMLKTGNTTRGQKSSLPVPQGRIPYENPMNTRSINDPNEYVTLALAAEAERERLLELVTVLNRRLDRERNETDQLSESLRLERNKLAKLETKLQRLEMERVGMSRTNIGYKARSSKSVTTVTATEEPVAERARLRVELLEEECLALKTRLATVQQDKATDLAMYRQMLDQARKIFQDACKSKSLNAQAYQGKPPSSVCHSIITI